ncbi:MAG TPA: hypothetical protein DDW52_11915 [Planctomycetaceae bacterium]|nr:hypothetical protein [Planctomycetaceae bacterium]
MRSQTADPTFQHLLDAEREDARAQSRRPTMARSRPGDSLSELDEAGDDAHQLASSDEFAIRNTDQYDERQQIVQRNTGQTEVAEVLSAEEARDLEAFGRAHGEESAELLRRSLLATRRTGLDTPQPPANPAVDSSVKMSFSDRANHDPSGDSYERNASLARSERTASRPAQNDLGDSEVPTDSYAQRSDAYAYDTRRRTGVRTAELRPGDAHAYGPAPSRSTSYDSPGSPSYDSAGDETYDAPGKPSSRVDAMSDDTREPWINAGEFRSANSDDWRDLLRAAIELVDAEAIDTTSPERKAELERNSRLLSMMLGDLSASMKPIESGTAQVQEYLQYSIKALSDITDSDGHPEIRKRATLALQSQRKATQRLADASELEVGNATFCTAVESFGDIEEFGEFRFSAGQEVLLYCEVDNFVSLPVPDGKTHETHLRGSYKIVRRDSGAPVESQTLKGDRHVSKAARRDYFMVYRIWMPEPIEPGMYDLRLTIEDVNGRKYGQANIEFEIAP